METRNPLLVRGKLKDTLLQYSHTHFAHAEGSQFMQEPLSHLLEYNGLTPFGNHITTGQPLPDTYNFDKPTSAILQNLCQKVPPTGDQQVTLDKSLLEGIKK